MMNYVELIGMVLLPVLMIYGVFKVVMFIVLVL